MIELNKYTLTEEQKRAFQRGDKYYVSPLKQYTRTSRATDYMASSSAYVSSGYKQIYAAAKDRKNSRSWN